MCIPPVKVFASSAQRVNRTAVQCVGLRKGPGFTDYYSYFVVILVPLQDEDTMSIMSL